MIMQQRNGGDARSDAYALKVAATIRLSFPQVQDALQSGLPAFALERLNQNLANDYRILTDLLAHVTGGDSIEHRILMIDYRIMQVWYWLTKSGDGSSRAAHSPRCR
jgi:hypothetical protein